MAVQETRAVEPKFVDQRELFQLVQSEADTIRNEGKITPRAISTTLESQGYRWDNYNDLDMILNICQQNERIHAWQTHSTYIGYDTPIIYKDPMAGQAD